MIGEAALPIVLRKQAVDFPSLNVITRRRARHWAAAGTAGTRAACHSVLGDRVGPDATAIHGRPTDVEDFIAHLKTLG
ncbi:MAG: hypothetical protein LUO89_14260 [Methanothrix sp.]|nr:hypothetical protein [Methanothrix sp.]